MGHRVSSIGDLAAVLRRGLDGDEAVARQAMAHPDGATGRWVYSSLDVKDTSGTRLMRHDGQMGAAKHAARHDPASALRDIASKRALLDEALGWEHYEVDDPWYCCPALPALAGRDIAGPCDCGRDARVHAVLTHLAQPYQEAQ
jgi:Family of unknown function (DUF6221)